MTTQPTPATLHYRRALSAQHPNVSHATAPWSWHRAWQRSLDRIIAALHTMTERFARFIDTLTPEVTHA